MDVFVLYSVINTYHDHILSIIMKIG